MNIDGFGGNFKVQEVSGPVGGGCSRNIPVIDSGAGSRSAPKGLFLRLGWDGGLLVEGESPGAVVSGVDAGHERDERGLVLVAVGATGVDEDRVIATEGDESLSAMS